ncbi:hypothetical protein [Motilibacter deserti]|uniref:ATP-binding protein n=1 Tax=Motilibacter deserti TaxID=2714956 RepID=A0ABX0H520_9ACTN|nr:hypothetical protein [Motilibacter deserti]NHC16518.1 hypothetical protein [Motilibacter deserti]
MANHALRRVIPGSPFNVPAPEPAPVQAFAEGELVNHDRHGMGRVTTVESSDSVIVDFGSGPRRVTSPSTRLTKL